MRSGASKGNQNFIISGSADTNVKIWDVRQKGAIQTFKGHMKGVSDVDISPDCHYAASGDHAGLVKIWDLTAGKCLKTFDLKKFSDSENPYVISLAFNPQDFCLAVASSDKVV